MEKRRAPQEESEHMCAIFSDVPQEQHGPESQRVVEKASMSDLSRIFPWSGTRRRDGGNKEDDESPRKKECKQTGAAKKPDGLGANCAEAVDVLSLR